MSQLDSPVWRFLRKYGYQVGFWLIVILAAYFRFYHLNQLPPGLHSSEAVNGHDIFRLLDKHQWWPPYSVSGPGNVMLFYLQALSVLILGNTILALRIAPAITGVAAVIVTYYLAREWFGPRVALVTGFLMAVTPWVVTLSRDSQPAALTPLLVALTFWLFTKALQTKKRLWFILGGLCLGVGVYGDSSFRLIPVAFLVVTIFLWLRRRQFAKTYLKPATISLIIFAVMLVPMALYGLRHPKVISVAASNIGVLNPSTNGGHALSYLASSTTKTILMFNMHGDDNYRQNLGGQPLLNFFVGLMFLTGIIICLSQVWRPKYLTLLVTLVLMLLAEILIADSVPNAFRIAGAIPAVMLLAAIGINYWLDIWYSTFPINSAARASGLLMISIPLVATLYQGYNQYFVAWAKSPETYLAYSEDATSIANFVNSTPTKASRYTITDDQADKTIYYLAGRKDQYKRIATSDIANLPVDSQARQFIIANSLKDDALKALKAKYPKARLASHHSSFSGAELFNVYEVQP